MTASFDEAASSGVGIRDGDDGDNIDIPAELLMIDRPESIDLRHLYSVSFSPPPLFLFFSLSNMNRTSSILTCRNITLLLAGKYNVSQLREVTTNYR